MMMNRLFWIFLLLVPFSAPAFDLSESAKISILTCSPGQDLYSTFGHSAIRLQDDQENLMLDAVYNYGTFVFDDDFYLKFTRGKLNYFLSRSRWADFQYGYLSAGRGIVEQELDLTPEQVRVLVDLLEENYLPENREYLYDFFYDNCSTRIRDILKNALGDGLKFIPVERDPTSFRQMTDPYMLNLPWGDFGIDMGLAVPADLIMGDEDDMFLPEYLFAQIDRAILNGKPLVKGNNELLLEVEVEPQSAIWVPSVVFWSLLVLVLLLFFTLRKSEKAVGAISATLMFIYGLVGLFLFLLWTATDHVATINNLNVMWLWPSHLVYVFIKKEKSEQYWMISALVLFFLVLVHSFLPQQYPANVTPLLLVGLTCSLVRTSVGKRLASL
ncbi:MAG: hypothetical protein ACI84C_001288 [Flavobacteriales bacterium]|jgi:hypothetical protein